MDIWTLILAIGLPSAIIGFAFRRIEKKLDEDKEERKRQEEARRKYEVFQVKTLTAVTGLCKANAIALQNGKCNGETKAALAHLQQVKHETRDFLTEQGIDHLF